MTETLLLIGILALFGVGLYGMMILHNFIKLVIALQILTKTAVLAFVIAGEMNGQIQLGQSLALTVIVADTMVAVVGLALAVQVRRHFGTLDIRALSTLKR